ncbi:hypothetical protein [Sphingorhabdus sp. EL138]|uniref:hypothetical protein n=1 Tax=Sphingorhabdus sp. EL138 TaxID=2073156 RepID=UPI000D69FF64|nr:hypothetical protein [Sphingorhabdus sp. EL138]
MKLSDRHRRAVKLSILVIPIFLTVAGSLLTSMAECDHRMSTIYTENKCSDTEAQLSLLGGQLAGWGQFLAITTWPAALIIVGFRKLNDPDMRLLLIGYLLVMASPIILPFASSAIGSISGCNPYTASAKSPCILLGTDLTGLLSGAVFFGWYAIFIWPVATVLAGLFAFGIYNK